MTKSSKPQKSWRDVLPIHPAALKMPPMSEAELKSLAEDIKKNGQQERVILFSEHGGEPVLLDGINRLDALEMLGMLVVSESGQLVDGDGDPLDVHELTGDGLMAIDPYAYVASANIHRRHLTAELKRDLIADVLKAQPRKSDRQIAGQIKASPSTVGKVRREMEETGDVSKLDTRTDSNGRQQPARKPPTPPAPTPKPTTDSDQPSCSFCGKGPNHDKVSTLIVSQYNKNHAAICNECVDLCVDLIAERKKTASHVADEIEDATEASPGPPRPAPHAAKPHQPDDDTGIPEFLRRRPS